MGHVTGNTHTFLFGLSDNKVKNVILNLIGQIKHIGASNPDIKNKIGGIGGCNKSKPDFRVHLYTITQNGRRYLHYFQPSCCYFK